jgi:transcriptional regulator of arginine metabolism
MPGTAARHRAVRSILVRHVVSSQGDLVAHLAADGFDVTQATVSRDLQTLGAVKARDGDGHLRYVLAEGLAPADESQETLGRAISEFVESIVPSGNLVVVKTPPGAAHVVAAAVDGSGLDGVLGTVAGDDTLMIVADETVGGRAVADELERIGAG